MSMTTQVKCDKTVDEYGSTCGAYINVGALFGTAEALDAAMKRGWWARAGRQLCPAHKP